MELTVQYCVDTIPNMRPFITIQPITFPLPDIMAISDIYNQYQYSLDLSSYNTIATATLLFYNHL